MIINNYKNESFIKWIVNNNCNYNCSYCFEKQFHKEEINIKNIINTAYKINDFINKNNISSIILLGGELFLLEEKVLLNILDILKSKKRKLYIITNFSKENFFYKNVYNFVKENFKSFEYKFSFHEEYISLQNFFDKIENFLQENNFNSSLKIQFTLTKENNFLLEEFINKTNLLKEKYNNVDYTIEKAYFFNEDRTKIDFEKVDTILLKKFNINGKLILADEIFKDGPLDNFKAKCFQPFFHLENNILYSHCYGRIITDDFINYIPEKIDNNFICNRHSCLIYKTSIIVKENEKERN